MATPVTAYIDAAAEPARSRLRALARVIRTEAPAAVERIAYGLATWHQGENLIHLGAFAQHIGIYPGAAAMVEFAPQLGGFKTSKGTIQVPHTMALPTDLVRRITRWRVELVATKATTKAATKATTKAATKATKKAAVKKPAVKKPAAKKPAAKKPAAAKKRAKK